METFLFTDIEADGPVPGLYSMLSFASVACNALGEVLEEFESNLSPLPGAEQHPETMAWWKTEPEAWTYSTSHQADPESVMKKYATWIESLPRNVIFVAHPGSFDKMWIEWYLWRFVGRRIFDMPALCIPSMLAGISGKSFSNCHRSYWPTHWLGPHQHSHKAIDDARGYARAFFYMRKEGIDF